MPVTTDPALVILFYVGCAIAALVLYIGIAALLDRRNARRGDRLVRRLPPPMPRRYPGCITCEAAEAVSTAAMIRHQVRDHAAGIQW